MYPYPGPPIPGPPQPLPSPWPGNEPVPGVHGGRTELVDEVTVEDEVVDVCAFAVDNAGYASSTAMMPIVAVMTVVFRELGSHFRSEPVADIYGDSEIVP